MRQLRSSLTPTLGMSVAHAEKVEIKPWDGSPIILFGLMFFAAVGAGVFGSKLVQPVNYIVVGVVALGGASAAFLLFAIPLQTILLLRKTFLKLGLWLRRGQLRTGLDGTYVRLRDRANQEETAHALADLAVVEFLRGANEAAERDLGRALELEPDRPDLLNNLGAVLAEEQQYDRAATMFARALQLNGPEHARTNLALVAPLADDVAAFKDLSFDSPGAEQAMAFNNIGVFHMRHGRTDQAREWFARAVRLNPKHAHSWANLGLLAYRVGRLREAVANLIKAARMAPENARIANNLAVMLAAAGKPAWSRQQLARAQSMEPANFGIRINMLAVRALEGHLDLAMKGMRPLAAALHHRGDALYNLAVMLLATAQYEDASEAASKAIQEGQTSADTFTNLAVALWQLGRRDEAVSHFRSAAEAQDASPHAARNYGRALLVMGRDDEAIKLLEESREKWRGDALLVLDLATALLSQAVRHYRPNMAMNERRAFFVELHRCYAGLETATRNIKQATPESLLNMGLYFYLREEYEKAAEYIEMAISTFPDDPEMRHVAGTAYGMAADSHQMVLEDGRRSLKPEGLPLARKAVPFLEVACEDRDSSPDSFYNLGRVLYLLDDCEKALEYLRKGIRLEDSEEMNTLAALAASRQARVLLDTVRTQSLMSDSKKEALHKRSRQLLDSAVQYFRQALLKNEINPTLHGNIGLAYMLRNKDRDVESALRHWQRMRAIAGERMAHRFTAFTQIQSAEHARHIQFDDVDVTCRDVDVPNWVCGLAPEPSGLHYVLEPVSEQADWRLIADDERLRRALRLRDRIALARAKLARLES